MSDRGMKFQESPQGCPYLTTMSTAGHSSFPSDFGCFSARPIQFYPVILPCFVFAYSFSLYILFCMLSLSLLLLLVREENDSSTASAILTNPNRQTPSQVQRLIDWNTDVLLKLLKQVVAQREASGKTTWTDEADEPHLPAREEGSIILDEVTEVIHLPGFHCSSSTIDTKLVELPSKAVVQLQDFVSDIANAYHNNPFHCLQHASQVSMAVSKLLSRIIVRELGNVVEEEEGDEGEDEDEETTRTTDAMRSHLHNHTYGITSDPLAQFALVLSAFVHAVDHRGVPNARVIEEEPEAAALYKNRSITEQRAVDKIWKKLMHPDFMALRQLIYANVEEKKRFRQVLVNSVLATDLDDLELQTLRMQRWEACFNRHGADPSPDDVHRKATIVMEHLVQAADIFHFMQPWIVYEKWSSRLFEEQYIAFKNGRGTNDPSETWYKMEMEFYDNYAIPLAMQLKDCDAFVVSSDEYLNYALKNRRQWASDGKEWVANKLAQLTEEGATKVPAGTRRLSLRGVFVTETGEATNEAPLTDALPPHMQRLVDWNVEMLQRMLVQVLAKRAAVNKPKADEIPVLEPEEGRNPIDEVAYSISIENFDAASTPEKLDADSVVLGLVATSQLRDYVTDISTQFRDNPFHGLDHGSQVCMTTRKFISRVVSAPGSGGVYEQHERTFGLSSDPLAQFAAVFAGLIHDVDHHGVTNSQLVREEGPIAFKYKNKSVMEQNAIDFAFNHLMLPGFEELRSCIYSNDAELKRFRQIVVNMILATDCMNETALAARKARFDSSFGAGKKSDTSKAALDLKATVSLETVMVAADCFHAMQSWQLYQKWNERHFQEMVAAYQGGRLHQDPAVFWYKSELSFFDEHVIPVAQEMSACGLFGTTGDEFLGFALSNRQQWAAKGGELVASMMARYHGKEVERARARRDHRRKSLSAQQA
jgi:hypothetical protein